MNAMTRSWSDLVEHYHFKSGDDQYDVAVGGMSLLCDWLDKNANQWGLYGFTSMHTLTIVQTEPFYPLHDSQQRLEVSPKPEGVVFFEFKPNAVETNSTYQREVVPEDTILQFCKFLKQIGWAGNIPFPE